MRYTGPKNKVARREGMDLGLKTPGTKSQASLLKRLNVLPGQHGVRGRRKQSERSKQLREKQKLRFLFGLTEKQLKRYFEKAMNIKGNTGFLLGQLLERRLDNVVYRLGFAPTRASARQLVGHGHITVNGKMVNIPSYKVEKNDTIGFRKEKTTKIPYIETLLSTKQVIIPSWFKKEGIAGKIITDPTSEDIEKQVNLRSVVEYYSR